MSRMVLIVAMIMCISAVADASINEVSLNHRVSLISMILGTPSSVSVVEEYDMLISIDGYSSKQDVVTMTITWICGSYEVVTSASILGLTPLTMGGPSRLEWMRRSSSIYYTSTLVMRRR